jgi:hypothetical protein
MVPVQPGLSFLASGFPARGVQYRTQYTLPYPGTVATYLAELDAAWPCAACVPCPAQANSNQHVPYLGVVCPMAMAMAKMGNIAIRFPMVCRGCEI